RSVSTVGCSFYPSGLVTLTGMFRFFRRSLSLVFHWPRIVINECPYLTPADCERPVSKKRFLASHGTIVFVSYNSVISQTFLMLPNIFLESVVEVHPVSSSIDAKLVALECGSGGI